MSNQNQKTISWQAPKFRHYDKGADWYTTLIAISVMIIGYFVIQADYFAAVTMAFMCVMLVYFSRQTPEMVLVEINDKQIIFGNIVFPYKNLRSFWIVNDQNHSTLNLETTTYLNNIIIIELSGQSPEEVKNLLLNFLPEHPSNTDPTFGQKVMHKLKF